jgi:hypothetical protein
MVYRDHTAVEGCSVNQDFGQVFFFHNHINMQLPRTPVSYNDIRNPRMVFIILAVVPTGKLQALHMRFLPKVSLSSHSPHCPSLASRLVSTSVP